LIDTAWQDILGVACKARVAFKLDFAITYPQRIFPMNQVIDTIEGTVSPKHQITIPSVIRDALGLRSGDKIEFKLEKGNVLELRVKRPTPSDTIHTILNQFDTSALELETGNNTVSSVRKSRRDVQ
jgi:AbrB family looped-hinge helix DNA binding protein